MTCELIDVVVVGGGGGLDFGASGVLKIADWFEGVVVVGDGAGFGDPFTIAIVD